MSQFPSTRHVPKDTVTGVHRPTLDRGKQSGREDSNTDRRVVSKWTSSEGREHGVLTGVLQSKLTQLEGVHETFLREQHLV